MHRGPRSALWEITPPTEVATDASIEETRRWPRMMGRQIFVYSVAFMLTGEAQYLQHAKAGVDWLVTYAWDQEYGGWFGIIHADGSPSSIRAPKYAQDMAYAAQGLAAYFFVTRDPLAEEYLLKTYKVIRETMWDEQNNRVWDGINREMTREVDQSGGGWELVAILDQINAYMMLSQPFLTEADNREAWKDSLLLMGQSLIDHFLRDGYFWGQHDAPPRGGRHVDFGHTLKSFWMLNRMHREFGAPDFEATVQEYAPHWLDLAYDAEYGFLGFYAMNNWDSARYGSSWWVYVECQQFAATLNLSNGGAYTPRLTSTSRGWLDHFVDEQYGEVFQGIDRQGNTGDPPVHSNFKSWEWKNGFHSAEHALIMYLHGRMLEKRPAELYFAASANPQRMKVAPYNFQGEEVYREVTGSTEVQDTAYQIIKVGFTGLQ
jgi:mannose/cellobiose epimerase-like protein (N-acyl-D-glucosamine 2-epimerase family)